jgi:D-alanyl-lipoteichoic acid acyltransferase DltB (MBOAT superfamily)
MPRGERWRPFIIVASFVFYAGWDWRFCFLLAFSIVWNQVFAVAIHGRTEQRTRKALLAVAVAGDVALLGYFKYYGFFVTSTHNLFAFAGIDVPLEVRSIVLPVGISFFTFMGISYVVDTCRGDFEPVSFSKFAAYLSFFPHLVAGPIVRPGELLPQFESPRDPRYVDTARAFYLIATGLFMKVVIANYLAANIVDEVFGAPNLHSSLEVLVGIYAYAVQIYADFFGYTNIAIGIALLLGFTFPQNFDAPYTAVSIQDFWRRWHMTLSRWLRDYLYIPLGGNRGSRLFTYRNLMLTMLIGGLWHGAGWTFVAWGAIHGTALVVERWWRDRPGFVERPWTRRRRAWHRFVTFQVVCFAWIFFRADSFADAWDLIEQLFTAWGEPSPLVTGGVLAAIAVGIGSQYLPRRVPLMIMARFSRLPIPAQAAVLSLALLVTHAMGPEGVAPFIYFQF